MTSYSKEYNRYKSLFQSLHLLLNRYISNDVKFIIIQYDDTFYRYNCYKTWKNLTLHNGDSDEILHIDEDDEEYDYETDLIDFCKRKNNHHIPSDLLEFMVSATLRLAFNKRKRHREVRDIWPLAADFHISGDYLRYYSNKDRLPPGMDVMIGVFTQMDHNPKLSQNSLHSLDNEHSISTWWYVAWKKDWAIDRPSLIFRGPHILDDSDDEEEEDTSLTCLGTFTGFFDKWIQGSIDFMGNPKISSPLNFSLKDYITTQCECSIINQVSLRLRLYIYKSVKAKYRGEVIEKNFKKPFGSTIKSQKNQLLMDRSKLWITNGDSCLTCCKDFISLLKRLEKMEFYHYNFEFKLAYKCMTSYDLDFKVPSCTIIDF